MRFQGRTVLITGASRNIGRATALAFAREGANLVLTARSRAAELEAVAGEARAVGAQVLAVLADVADPAQVQDTVRQATERFGAVDVLVNNAAIRPYGPVLQVTPEQWRQVLAVDLDGPFFCIQAVLPGMMAQRWGRVISVSGQAPFKGHPARPHVAAAKAALIGLSRALATEFGQHNITFNCVAPGWIDTEREAPPSEEQLAHWRADSPLGRLGMAQEVAAAVLYLASEEAGFVTGQTLHVNGGVYYQ